MHDEQNRSRTDFAERDKPLLVHGRHVALRQGIRIVERQGCCFKADAVLSGGSFGSSARPIRTAWRLY